MRAPDEGRQEGGNQVTTVQDLVLFFWGGALVGCWETLNKGKQRSSQLLTLSNELLDQLGARHPDEGTVSVMSNSSGQQGFSGTGGSIEQHTLNTLNTQTIGNRTTQDD